MPNIEIISLRFNLDKDEDRRLFEVLQKRTDPGKRNEFLKQSLLECLSGSGARGKAARTVRKQPLEPAYHPAERLPEVPGPETRVASGPQAPPKPVAAHVADEKASEVHGAPNDADSEAAGLVASFVQ